MKTDELIDFAVDLGTRCKVSSWSDLKKIVLVSIPSGDRSKFSTRDPDTKRQSLNSLEIKIINNYEKKTGVSLEVPR